MEGGGWTDRKRVGGCDGDGMSSYNKERGDGDQEFINCYCYD